MQPSEPITNLFGFIDWLERLGFSGGTANENRAFIYETLAPAQALSVSMQDIQSAYASVGITTPDAVFSDIYDFVYADFSAANQIQIYAPTSKIATQFIPEAPFDMNEQFIVYGQISYYDPDLETSITVDRYIKFNDNLTLSQITNSWQQDFGTRYGVTDVVAEPFRIYKNSNYTLS